ncbi:MAG: Rrf2 family transcriptional regulator [Myxococcota bacterium]
MRATQQLKYALYGVFDLAYNGQDAPVPLQVIGERQGIPTRYLEQIFQRLRRAGLVRSKRGPGGGYLLASPAHEISIADVVVAVQGALLSMARSEADGGAATPGFVWERIDESLRQALGACTIADLCREAEERGVERASEHSLMYEI